jgi:hypothetical protein
MIRLLLCFALLFFVNPVAQAQHTISGRVIDAIAKKPMPFANVFIASSTKGIQTGTQGEFSLSGLHPGRYKLVISFVGYETRTIDFLLPSENNFLVELESSVTKLDEVTIRAQRTSRLGWYDNFEIFKENFIGTSENASLCSFHNPRALDFVNENNQLIAAADSLLIIDNHGLGYRMKFQLEDYLFQRRAVHIRYVGYVMYEPLQPVNDLEAKTWAERRLKAYYGSRQHFMNALSKRALIGNGFYVNLVTTSFNKKGKMVKEGIADTTLTIRTGVYARNPKKISVLNNYNRILDSLEATRGRTTMKFEGELEIQYVNEPEPYYFVRARSPKEAGYTMPQRSNFKLRAPIVEISSNGQLVPEDGIETRGYWSWELVAESLPLDYDPKVDLQILEGIDSRGSE